MRPFASADLRKFATLEGLYSSIAGFRRKISGRRAKNDLGAVAFSILYQNKYRLVLFPEAAVRVGGVATLPHFCTFARSGSCGWSWEEGRDRGRFSYSSADFL